MGVGFVHVSAVWVFFLSVAFFFFTLRFSD